MSDDIMATSKMSEIWYQRPYYRYAVLDETTTEPPVLQVAWQSDKGTIVWRRVPTEVVSREEYDRPA